MRIQVVTGPPCAGKSTHVDEHRAPGDVVVDLDRIGVALGHHGDHLDWTDKGAHQLLARVARTAVLKAVLAGVAPHDVTLWLIETAPERWQLAHYTRRGAEFTHLDPGRGTCHSRATAASRPASTHEQIDAWYDTHGDHAAEEFFD